MGTSPRAVTFPYAVKTAAVTNCNVYPWALTNGGAYFGANAKAGSNTPFIGGVAMQCFPPLQIYQTVGLYVRFVYTFNSTYVPTSAQSIIGVSCTNTVPPFPTGSTIPPFQTGNSSIINNFMPLNITAVSNQVNVSLDVSSLLTGTPTNIVCIWFPAGASENVRGSNGSDVLNLFKLDLVYQTIGVRDEQ